MSSSVKRFGAGEGDANASPERWGGKGAGLMRMAAEGLPVPPGFTITTEACAAYEKYGDKLLDAIMVEALDGIQWLTSHFGYTPLLSVRSGARVSMPGMMDTILNVGMTREALPEWTARLNETAARDSYRRLLQMIGDTALGIKKERFEDAYTAAGGPLGLPLVIDKFEAIYADEDHKVPASLETQLRLSIEAVFKSWKSDRAIEYRKLNGIPEDWGTSVTIQSMVFGNMNDLSCSGVLFSRNPSTGEPGLYGEYLINAQGEDVVAGTHTPLPIQTMQGNGDTISTWDPIYAQLCQIAKQLETSRKDMQDMEFTVQDGTLYMLQTRDGKRSAQAAFRIALDMFKEGLITEAEMLSRITTQQFKVVKRPQVDPAFKGKPALTGIAGSMGVATGKVVLSSKAAVAKSKDGPVILVSKETTPEDIAGMAASVGILTQTGGATSHAAVVARGMDKPCVVGCTELVLGETGVVGLSGGSTFEEGEVITLCGQTGRVWKGQVPVIDALNDEAVTGVLDHIMEQKGWIEQSSVPKCKAVVPLADWLALDEKGLASRIVAVKDVLATGEWLLIDATLKSGDSEDAMLWNIAGPQTPEKRKFLHIVDNLCTVPLKGAFVSGDAEFVAKLVAAGAQEVPTVTTVSELLGMNGMVRLSWTLAQALGGAGDMQVVIDALRKTGKTSATVMSQPMSKNYAAFVALGEAAA